MSTPILDILWIIPLLPLLGAAINGLFGKNWPNKIVNTVALSSTGLSFLAAIEAVREFFAGGQQLVHNHYFDWITAGNFTAGFDLQMDQLTVVMVLVVTGVGFLIHIYSTGYMSHEGGYYRFFSYLNLFMFFMLILVLAANYVLLFVGWEGVGLASYLLIGFYFLKKSASDAGKKAFIVNRIGDFGFMLGMFLLFKTFGTLDFTQLFAKSEPWSHESWGVFGTFTVACLLLFTGACGKSAQLPLYVWLPDAMEGPTPVSALIHAATMVTAGVYLVCRMGPLFLASPDAMTVVAVVGATTALVAAIIGAAQNDIKKVLAYSTVSQLGYMVLATGVGAFTASIFHLMTHAFFKALLFLGAGSVIHALSGEQEITRMGGLRRMLPWTHATFLIGVLAIAGVPPFAGFFSKDEILWAALAGGPGAPGSGSLLLWGVGVLTAGLTAFYMIRLYLLVFAGAPRVSDAVRHHVHESPPLMIAPLVLLAAGACLAGFLGVPHFLSQGTIPNHFEEILSPVLGGGGGESGTAFLSEWGALSIALLASLAGIGLAGALYARGPRPEPAAPSPLLKLARGRFFADELIEAVVLEPYRALCRAMKRVDETLIDGLVNAVGGGVDLGSQLLRLAQTGYVRNYALAFLVGSILILYYALR